MSPSRLETATMLPKTTRCLDDVLYVLRSVTMDEFMRELDGKIL